VTRALFLAGRLLVWSSCVLPFAACGDHYSLDPTEVSATTLPDGRVQVTATVQCAEVGESCPSQWCVSTTWYAGTLASLGVSDTYGGSTPPTCGGLDGGAPLDTVQVCPNVKLGDGATTTVQITSDGTIASPSWFLTTVGNDCGLVQDSP